MSKKPFNVSWLFLAVPIILIAAVISFLVTKDGYGHGITGAKALSFESGWFWVIAFLGILAAIGCGYYAYKNDANGGKEGVTILAVAVGMVILVSVFGKACTDKANQGVTAPHYHSIK
jgi:4-amino-4-deoxy-L-arabinose transferase-like glycosyltransferase